MTRQQSQIQEIVCETLCASAEVRERKDGTFVVTTPFTFPDGDQYMLYVKPLAGGGYRVTDMGHTLMHISYEMDVDKLREGSRGSLLSRVLAEAEVNESEGEVFVEAPQNKLGESLFRLGQAITRVHDITFLNRYRVESTFYEDLYARIGEAVPQQHIERDYVVPGIRDAENYTVDYFVPGKNLPLYIYGVPDKSKVRLVTIELQHLLSQSHNFDSIIVFADQESIPRKDLARLSNVGGEQVASLDARAELAQKIRKRAAA